VVKAGDTIAELDQADYQVAVENAEAAPRCEEYHGNTSIWTAK
jgi:multidrug resistance efflux pump